MVVASRWWTGHLHSAAKIVAVTAFGPISTAGAAHVDIVSTNIEGALRQFVVQTDSQVLFDAEEVRGAVTSRVTGELEPAAVLAQMLAGSGLHYSAINERTFAVSRRAQVRGTLVESGQRNTAALATPDGSGSSPPASNEGSVADTQGGVSSGQQATRGTVVTDAPSATLETIIVTGSNIRGVSQSISPVKIYDRTAIEATGAATLDQFTRTLPENFSSVDASTIGRSPPSSFDQTGSNPARGSSINIHGLGPGSTLILLNGRRLPGAGGLGNFVDVSMIPLSALDRVEVLTDGASAVYGSDAIGGVVNLKTRADFAGAETAIRYGGSSRGGLGQLTANQLIGTSWDDGNVFAIVEHHKQQALMSDKRDYVTTVLTPVSLLPEQRRTSGFATGQMTLGASRLSADAFYTTRDTIMINQGTLSGSPVALRADADVKQAGGTLDLQRHLRGDWVGEVMVSYSSLDQFAATLFPETASSRNTAVALESSVLQSGARADGTLYESERLSFKAAVGGEYRNEKLRSELLPGNTRTDYERDISSVYAETLFTLNPAAHEPWQRLALSLAGRYDHYSDVGASTNPKYGLLWSPFEAVELRATYSTSFKAPPLPQLSDTQLAYFTINLPDSAAPDGATVTLVDISSGNPGLRPEKSRSVTAGMDLQFPQLPSLKLSATYFKTEFRGRIGSPPLAGGIFALFSQEDVVGPFLTRTPQVNVVEAYFDTGRVTDTVGSGPAGVEAIYDSRLVNIALTSESGLDVAVQYALQSPFGDFSFALSGTRLFHVDYRAMSNTSAVSYVDKLSTPLGTRLRSSLGWSRRGLALSVGASHSDSYENNLAVPAEKVSSWTTLDLHFSYTRPTTERSRLLSGIQFSVDVENVVDKDPPFVAFPRVVGTSFGYDATNASPLGRVISAGVSKAW